MNIAELGIKVESASAEQAGHALDALVQSGARAEQAVEKLGGAWDSANQKFKRTAEEQLKAKQSLSDLQGQIDPLVAKLQKLDTLTEQLGQHYEAGNLSLAQYQAELAKLDRQYAALEKNQGRAANSADEQAAALQKLVAQIDPVSGALDKLAIQQQKLKEFRSLGLIDAGTFEKLNSRLEQTRTGLSAFDENLNRTGNTAKQTAAALRGVPAQFTDIVVSLQAGQAPLTVLLQQGGQLKDMFGGIGPAARALGGYVAGLVNPFTAAAAAVGVLGLAYYQGSEESERYGKALILTGNAAGTSANQLAGIAEKISAVSGTTGQAAEALTLLASSGKVSADNLEAIGSAAVSFSSATGTAISDVVQQYAELGKAPVEASRKLNEQYGYLTTAVYQQIVALVEQGKTQEAATVAQRAYAEAQQQMTIKVKANLGTLETAWAALGSGAKKAWDAMLGIGRESTLEDRIKDLDSKIKRRAELGGYDNSVLKRQLATLKDQLSVQQRQSEEQGKQRQSENAGIEASVKAKALTEATLTNEQKRNKEKKEYLELVRQIKAVDPTSDLVKQANVDKVLANIAEKYKDAKVPKVKAPTLDTTSFNQLQNDLKLVVGEYENADKKIEASAQAGLISQRDAYTQRAALLDQEREKVKSAYADQISSLEQLQGKSNLSAQQKIQLEQKVSDAQAAQTKALTDLDAKREQLSIREQGRQDKLARSTDSYTKSLDAQVELLRLQGERAAAAVGMGREQAALYNELTKANDEYVKGLRDLDKLLAERSIDQEEYDKRLSALQRQQAQLQEQVIDNFRLMQVAQSDWSNGANAAWQDYLSNARDVAGQTRDAFTDALRGMEDYLLSFITGTKSSFKDLVKSIIADFARIQLKQIISGIGGSSGGSGLAGSISSLFSSGAGTGGGGGLNLVSLAQNAYSVYSGLTGVGSAIYGGYQVGGLTGAAQAGVGYYGNMLSNGANYVSGLFGGASGAAAGSAAASSAAGATAAGYTGQAYSTWAAGQYASQAASKVASTISSYGPYFAAIAGALQGWQAAGFKGAVAGAGGAVGGMYAGAQLGSYFGPIGTAIGGAIGAVAGAAFGSKLFGGQWQTKDAGLSLGVEGGDLSATGFEYQKKKGGLFGKNKKRTVFNALDADTQAALDMTFDAGMDQIQALYEQFGIDVSQSALDGLTVAATQISTKGKTTEELQQLIGDWFTGTFDSITDQINTAMGSQFKAGLTLDGLKLLLGNLISVNGMLDLLNVKVLKITPAGAYAAEALSALAGGMDKLTANVNTYYDAFFTEAEKQADTLAAVNAQFQAMGVSLPALRQGYRDIVSAIDVTTAAGQAMFTSLTSLAATADSYYDILESQAQAAKQSAQEMAQALAEAQASMLSAAFSTLQRAVQKQQSALSDAYNRQTEALNASLSSSQSAVSSLTSMTNSLSSALKTMLGQSDQATRVLYGQATATLETAAAIARAGGSLANFQGLDDALSTVTGNNSSGYGDWLSFARDQGRSASLISELSATAGDQLTSAEKTVKGIQDQLDLSKKQFDLESKMLQGQLDLAQAQIDAINGVDNTLLSMVDALNQFSAAVLTASPNGTGGKNADTLIEAAYQSVLGRSADKAGAAYWKDKLVSGQLSSNDLRGAIGQAGAANGESINTAYQNILGRAPDAAGLAYWQQQVAAGNISDINAAIRAAAMANGQIPAFAAGGLYGGGLALVGEKGPELINFNKPGYVHTAADTASMMGGGNGAVVRELQALRAENQEMRYAIASIAKHTRKTADGIQQQNEVGVATLETA